MDVAEPHVRRRGFVVIPTDPNLDDEAESAEGITIRIRVGRSELHRHLAVTSSRNPESIVHRGSSRQSAVRSPEHRSMDREPVKTMIGTGIRQQSHSHR
jgi:hypothetical protein